MGRLIEGGRCRIEHVPDALADLLAWRRLPLFARVAPFNLRSCRFHERHQSILSILDCGLVPPWAHLNELQAENKLLKEAQTRGEVENALKAKNYAPQAAGLFTGEPAKLDEWLTANGGALAKLPSAEGEQRGSDEGRSGPH
ncbi:hypothetical protein ACYSUO_40510 [Streptomyces sp. UC4497]